MTGFQYTGKEHDQHSSFDFQYYGARYYDPAHGIFTSVDAAGEFASGYVYCGGNPISLVDPDGNSVLGTIGLIMKVYGYFQATKAVISATSALISGEIDFFEWGESVGRVALSQFVAPAIVGEDLGRLNFYIGVSKAAHSGKWGDFAKQQATNLAIKGVKYIGRQD